MFEIGDCVVKENIGLCRVEDILYLNGNKEKLYYLLIPFSDENLKVYVPVDYQADSFRKALDHDKAWEVIESISGIDAVEIEEEKMREQQYKDAIRSCHPKKWVSIIKTMYLRNQERSEKGKKNTLMDDKYFKIAEDYLYSELAYAIGKEKNEMEQLIEDTINKKRVH